MDYGKETTDDDRWALDRGLARSIAAARGDADVVGVMVRGSLARDERHPGADVDLHALVVDGAGRPTEVDVLDGVMVETAYWDEAMFVRRLAERPATAYGLVEGRILFDTGDRLARLQAEARRRLDDHVPLAQEWAGVEHWLRSARIKLGATRTAADAVRLGLIVSLNLHEVLRWLFLVIHVPCRRRVRS